MAPRKQPSLTVDETFQRFLRLEKDPHAACEWFNQALREGLPLWCDGGPQPDGVPPAIIATTLRVEIKKTSDGWTAKMAAPFRALNRTADEFEWTVSAARVNALLKSEPSGRKRGRKPKPGDRSTLFQ